jgi:hypothetical protein
MEKSYPLLDYNYLQSNIRQINKGKKWTYSIFLKMNLS